MALKKLEVFTDIPEEVSLDPIHPSSPQTKEETMRVLSQQESQIPNPLEFGAILGFAPGNVAAYSSEYELVDEKKYPSRASYVSVCPNSSTFFGYKYQCVEFARRWLVMVHNVSFASIGMAYEIFNLPFFEKISLEPRNENASSNSSDSSENEAADIPATRRVPLQKTRNGSCGPRPTRGSVILWEPCGYFRWTGHVAIVTSVTDSAVCVAEQNVWNHDWEGKNYSRELPAKYEPETGRYVIYDLMLGDRKESRGQPSIILGWVTPLIEGLGESQS